MTERNGAEFRTPVWLRDLVGEHAPRVTARPPQSPSAGELWYATSESGIHRILLVLATDEDRGLARATLTSTEAEVATDSSLLFSADELGTAFDVVIETDFVMPVWLRQLSTYVGRLPIPIERVQQAADSGNFSADLDARRGMPLHGPHDTRVAVRDQELEELWRIAGECVAEIEAWDAERAVVDPRLFLAAWAGEPDYGAAVGILNARRRGASLAPWTYRQLQQQRGEQRPSRTPDLVAAFRRFQNDIVIALEDTPPPSVHRVEWLPAPLTTDPFDRGLIDTELARAVDRGAKAIDFYTIDSLVPRGLRESRGLLAALGQRQCVVTICT